MLHIKQKFHLPLPHLPFTASKPLHFSTVKDDDDELTQAIVADPVQHDNKWQLSEHPDTVQLEQFWTEVEDDIQHDPKWISLADDSQNNT